MTANKKLHGTPRAWQPSSDMIRCRNQVAAAFDVTPEELIGKRRLGHMNRARHAVVWVIRQRWPQLSYPLIGRLLGDRDHSTIINSRKGAEKERLRCATFRTVTDALAGAEQNVPPLRLTLPTRWLRPESIKTMQQIMRERPVKRKNALTVEDLDAVKRRTGTIALGKAIDTAYGWDANGSPVAREAPALPATMLPRPSLPSGADAELAALGFGV